MLKQIHHKRKSRDHSFLEKKLAFLKMLLGKNHDNDTSLNYNEMVTRFISKVKNK